MLRPRVTSLHGRVWWGYLEMVRGFDRLNSGHSLERLLTVFRNGPRNNAEPAENLIDLHTVSAQVGHRRQLGVMADRGADERPGLLRDILHVHSDRVH